MKLGPKAARKKLVEALRSGEYTQTYKALRDREGYCCLGVACDLYRKIENPGEQWKPIEGGGVYEFMGSSGTLPHAVRNWLGFAFYGGGFYSGADGGCGTLMSMNDSGKSFEYIADAIEAGAVNLKEAL